MTFDFKDPKEISAVSLSLDSPLEPIVGYAKGISGTVLFDPAQPLRSKGRIAVDVSSVQFANDGYTATAQGYALNGKKWPQLVLAIKRVESVRKVSATRYEGIVLADFTCRGVTKPKRLAVTADLLPGRAEERTNGQVKGDLLVLRTHFAVSRKEHGISEGIPDAMVGDTIEVGVAVVGIHATPSKPVARWEVELADRDDPVFLTVERTGDRLMFHSARGDCGATVVGETGFRLDPNPTYGEATGTLDENGSGTLRIREGEVALRGHRVGEFSSHPSPMPKGTGFANLSLAKRMRDAGTAGMAVVHIANDRVVELGLYGVKRAGGNEPIVDSTLFQSGTMGTPVLQLAILRLAAEGKIDLEKRANDYLGEAPIPDGPQGWGGRITVRDLMRGTSGFGFSKSGGYSPGTPMPPSATPPPVVAPGTVEGVSATNEILLGRILVAATGRSAQDVVAQEVFAPLGMTDSTYEVQPAGAASGHYSTGEPTLDPVHVYPDDLGNGLWTSARDGSRLVAELGRLLGGRPNRLLAEKDRPLLARVGATKSVLGIRRSEDGGMYLGGDPYGFYCEFFIHPERGEAIVVMQNRMMAWRLTNDVVAALRGMPEEPQPMTARRPRLGGGPPLSLDDVRGKASLVVFFLNEQCGVTHAYKARLQRLVRDFAPKGFAFVAVRTGRKQFPDRPVELPERAYLKMPFIDDAGGDLMRKYEIGQSMTFVVLDAHGAIRYQGGLDDSVDEARVRKTPLRDALRDLASGRTVRVPRAGALGCAILPVER